MKVLLATENEKTIDEQLADANAEFDARLAEEAADAADRVYVPQATKQLAVLRPFHREAIRRLIEGQRIKDVAKDIGITAKHLSFLKNNDPLFIAELDKGMLNKEQDVLKRIQLTSYEALDVVREIMRTGKSDNIRLQAAQTILDRAGYSKLEKKVTVMADAETVIRELNRRKADRPAIEVEVEARQDS